MCTAPLVRPASTADTFGQPPPVPPPNWNQHPHSGQVRKKNPCIPVGAQPTLLMGEPASRHVSTQLELRAELQLGAPVVW